MAVLYNNINLERASKIVRTGKVHSIETTPIISYISLNNTGLFPYTLDHFSVDKVFAQPKPNSIERHTISNMYKDVAQTVELLSAFQRARPMSNITEIIKAIHVTFATKKLPIDLTCQKGASNVKNWLKTLTNIHPLIDTFIKNNVDTSYKYWKNYSNIIGHNTVQYNTDTSSIDVNYWGETSHLTTNEITRQTFAYFAPSYIRETTRQKLKSYNVKLIQQANAKLSLNMARNLIKGAHRSSKPITGGEYTVKRPSLPILTHGHSLNNDWYHWMFRIMPILKMGCLKDCIMYCNEYFNFGDYTLSMLVNHLNPMKIYSEADAHNVRKSFPQGVEESFPTKTKDTPLYTDLNGNVVNKDTLEVNNDSLEP